MSSSLRDLTATTALQQQQLETWNSAPATEVVLEAATAVLAADDARGARVGAVTQADEVPGAAVDGLLELALYWRLHHRITEHNGSGGQRCSVCAAADRMWCTTLVDPVVGRLGVRTTELHDQVRRLVLSDLEDG